jgi:dihydrolipoamide dehydrogenase
VPGADAEAAAVLQREFRRKGIEVRLGTRFEELKVDGGGVRVTVTGAKGGEELRADQVLVAVGRRARTHDLGLDAAGVAVDAKGFVTVDARFRTSAAAVAAIGDVSGPPLLAHKASEEGIAAVEFSAGLARPPVDLHHVPACIYAQPQLAWVGLGEAEARARYGDDLRVGRFPFTASGKAIAAAHSAGFAKILAEPRYGQIVGAHVVGAGATELIAEMTLALTLEATTSEIAGTVHAHPTLSEALLEAALAAEGRSINF